MDAPTLIKRLIIVIIVLNSIFLGAFVIWLLSLVRDLKL